MHLSNFWRFQEEKPLLGNIALYEADAEVTRSAVFCLSSAGLKVYLAAIPGL